MSHPITCSLTDVFLHYYLTPLLLAASHSRLLLISTKNRNFWEGPILEHAQRIRFVFSANKIVRRDSEYSRVTGRVRLLVLDLARPLWTRMCTSCHGLGCVTHCSSDFREFWLSLFFSASFSREGMRLPHLSNIYLG